MIKTEYKLTISSLQESYELAIFGNIMSKAIMKKELNQITRFIFHKSEVIVNLTTNNILQIYPYSIQAYPWMNDGSTYLKKNPRMERERRIERG